MQCPKCHTEIVLKAKFCHECGTRIKDLSKSEPTLPDKDLGESSRAEAERRVATILFADLVGYTTMAESMDPEDVYTLIDRIFSRFKDIIKDKGGYIDKYIGDALIAVFGVPHADENDPQQAIHAALAMKDELKKISADLKRNVSIRIGINTGEVLWGNAGGGGSTVWGDTVNVAQRLQSAASINSVIISESTKRHLRQSFRLNQLPSLKLKGREQFVQAYEIVGIEEVNLSKITPFIGRENQLSSLKTILGTAVKEKNPSLVFLTGEAGVGKSRLISEFTDFLKNSSSEFRIFTERCLPFTQLPYEPVAEIIRHYFDLSNLSITDAQKRLAKEVNELFPDNPLMHHFLGFFLGMKYPNSPLEELTPDAARTAGFNALKTLLERAPGNNSALILIIDDIQWSDVGTRDFLDYLSNATLQGSLLIIATARPQENIINYINHIRDLAHSPESRWKLIDLPPFTKELTAQFVHKMLKSTRVSDKFINDLWIKTGGNPFFLEELLWGLVEERGSAIGDDKTILSLPENIWQIIESRIDRLPEKEKKVIKVASVFGRIFWEQGLNKCLPELTPAQAGLKESSASEEKLSSDISSTLRELESNGFITKSITSSYKDDAEYSFRHELIRDVAYRILLKRDRINIHETVLKFLQDKKKNNELTEELYLKLGSYHAEESNQLVLAIDFYEGYGDYEKNRYMLEESLLVYRKAYELVDKADLAEGAERKARLTEKEGLVYYHLNRYAEAVDSYERLRNLAPHWTWRVKGLLGIAEVYEKQANYEESFRYAGEAVEIAFHGKNNRLLGEALNLAALSLIGKGSYNDAIKLAERVKTSFTEVMEKENLSPAEASGIKKELARSINNIGLVRWYQGDYASALTAYESALGLMEEINNRYGIAASHINIGNIHRDQVNYKAALDSYQKSMATSQTIGSRRGVTVAQLNIGAICHDQGNYQSAEDEFKKSLDLSREINARHEETIALTSLGNLYHDQGECGRALMTHLTSLPAKRQLAEKSELVITLLNIATLRFERGDYGDVMPLINEAEEIALQVKAKKEIITALNALGRILVYFALMGGLPGVSIETLFSKARQYIQKTLAMAKSLNLKTQTLEALISAALVNIQQTIKPESLKQTPAETDNCGTLFHEAYKLLKEAEGIVLNVHHKESLIHYHFAWARYYIELINSLTKQNEDGKTNPEAEKATKEVVRITTEALNLTQQLGIKRLQPEAMFLYVQALSLAGEKVKAANYYETCRQLAEMLGLKPFLRLTARMPV